MCLQNHIKSSSHVWQNTNHFFFMFVPVKLPHKRFFVSSLLEKCPCPCPAPFAIVFVGAWHSLQACRVPPHTDFTTPEHERLAKDMNLRFLCELWLSKGEPGCLLSIWRLAFHLTHLTSRAQYLSTQGSNMEQHV